MERKKDYIKISLITVFFIIALLIRTLNYENIFVDGGVRFIDDGLPHMRLVENTIAHFPHRIAFDPFTFYPYGTMLHFGPIFDQAIALIAIIAGGGHPSLQTIQTVGAYFPVVLGAFLVIPVYFIGKNIFNEYTGIIAAGLYSIFPGILLSRSMVGFTDHHIAEVILSIIMLLFFILGLKKIDDRRSVIFYGFFSGLFFGLYLLVWPFAILFLMILGIYLTIQFIINHFQGKNSSNLTILANLTLGIPLLMILPYIFTIGRGTFTPAIYSYFHLFSFVFIIIAVEVMSLVSKTMQKRDMKRWYYPLSLLVIGIVSFCLLYPTTIGERIGDLFGFAFTSAPAYLTIGEQRPFFIDEGRFSLLPLWNNYAMFGFAFFPVFAYFLYDTFKRLRPTDILLAVWTIVLFILTVQHVRYSYYLVICIILFGAYMIYSIMRWTGAFEKKRRNKALIIIMVIFLALVFVYPTLNRTLKTAPPSGPFPEDWFEACQWMRYNTPEPDLDYYANYDIPEGNYQYGPNDYGVMSWWDYGHIITYEAHRIPNANPYQEGIGGPLQGNMSGACTFFTAQNVTEANSMLDELGTKYMIIDFEMAYGKFHAIVKWTGENENSFYEQYWIRTERGYEPTIPLYHPAYYRSMTARLYNFGGEEVVPDNSTLVISYVEQTDTTTGQKFKVIQPYKDNVTGQYLIGIPFSTYEEAEEYLEDHPDHDIVGTSPFVSPVPLEALDDYKLIYQSNTTAVEFGGGRKLSYVEIFEYIK
jgi:dolichyl-diphosphooligosaccharide--protein glycosyltransferase